MIYECMLEHGLTSAVSLRSRVMKIKSQAEMKKCYFQSYIKVLNYKDTGYLTPPPRQWYAVCYTTNTLHRRQSLGVSFRRMK
jgi:hypothetical protein